MRLLASSWFCSSSAFSSSNWALGRGRVCVCVWGGGYRLGSAQYLSKMTWHTHYWSDEWSAVCAYEWFHREDESPYLLYAEGDLASREPSWAACGIVARVQLGEKHSHGQIKMNNHGLKHSEQHNNLIFWSKLHYWITGLWITGR